MLLWLGCVLFLLAMIGVALINAAPGQDQANRALAINWTIGSLVLIGAALPAAAGLHWYLFRRHWRAGRVTPRGFLIASTSLWLTFTLCGVIPIVGCLLSGTIFPNIYLAAIVLLLLLGTWPKGEAMVHTHPRDAEDTDEEVMHFGQTPDERDQPPSQ
jgi:hypothetical protein